MNQNMMLSTLCGGGRLIYRDRSAYKALFGSPGPQDTTENKLQIHVQIHVEIQIKIHIKIQIPTLICQPDTPLKRR